MSLSDFMHEISGCIIIAAMFSVSYLLCKILGVLKSILKVREKTMDLMQKSALQTDTIYSLLIGTRLAKGSTHGKTSVQVKD